MLADLGGDDLLLKPCQQSLRLVQPHTEIGEIAEIIRPVDFHDVQGPPFAFGANLHQPQNPGHALPRVKDGPQNTRVTRIPKNLRQSLQCIAETSRGAWQETSGYNKRAKVEAETGRWKQVIGDGLPSRRDKRRVTEVSVAVDVLNRMLALGRPNYVLIVYPQKD